MNRDGERRMAEAEQPETFEAQQHRLQREILASLDWSLAEKAVVKWQLRLYGDFYTALWQAIARADEGNLARLALGFPNEVEGYKAWAWGDLGRRLRAAGLEI